MTEAKVLTLDEVRAQVNARAAELWSETPEDADEAPDPDPDIVARDEALERVCASLGYLDRSLAEVQAAKAAVERERDEAVREALRAKSADVSWKRSVEDRDAALERMRVDLEDQRRKKQQAVAQSEAMRAELASLRSAHREVGRQMSAVLDRAEEAADGTVEAPPAAPNPS
jgi:chromosome segregation ATPase